MSSEVTRVEAQWLVQNGEARQRMGRVLLISNLDRDHWDEIFRQAARQATKDVRTAMNSGKLWTGSYLVTDERDDRS